MSCDEAAVMKSARATPSCIRYRAKPQTRLFTARRTPKSLRAQQAPREVGAYALVLREYPELKSMPLLVMQACCRCIRVGALQNASRR